MNENIEYVDSNGLAGILSAIEQGIVPTITPDPSGRANTYICRFEEDTDILYLDEYQYDNVIEAIYNVRYSTQETNEYEETIEEKHNIIPPNSDTLLIDRTSSRFSSAIWYDNVKSKTVLLAGVGGIGSYVAFLLARMQIRNLLMYDPDIVEEANMSGQLYSTDNINAPKVEAIGEMCKSYASYYNFCAIQERFTKNCIARDIMICGFDNMSSRRVFFEKWKEHVKEKSEEDKSKCLFIDGRLSAEEFQILCIKGDDTYNIDRYADEYLFSDEEAEETICSYKQTSFMANMIGSYIVNLFINFCANECGPTIDRCLPFYIAYNGETLFSKVIL